MKVLVIIPAYNEQDSILSVVSELKSLHPDYDYLVVNDCSTDDTEKILRENGLNHISLPLNLGIGGGVQSGYRYAVQEGYDIAVQMDGDGQHDPAYLDNVVGPVARGECDMCVGSRFITGDGFQSSALRRFGIRFLSFLIKLSCGVKIYDVTSGYRATNAALNEYYAEDYAQDYPEPEAVVSAVVSGFSVKEAPVVMRERAGGVSSIRAFKTVYYMVKVSLAIVLCRVIHRRKSK